MISVIVLIMMNAGMMFAQSSTNYQIEGSVLDAGGGDRNSASYLLCDSVGQPSGTTISISSNYTHIPGFYECNVQTGDPGLDPSPTPTTPIPESGTLVLFGTGVTGMFILLRRRMKHRG
jgi:hypothetical protein